MARTKAAALTSGEEPEENGGTVEQTAGGEESAAENAGGGEAAGLDQSGGAEESPAGAEVIRLVYIGPSLTYEKLRSSQILMGTQEEIDDFMAPIVEKYPEAAYLLATPEELPEAMLKVESKAHILHKYYQDMLAKSRDKRY